MFFLFLGSYPYFHFAKNDGEMIQVWAAALRAKGLSFILFGFYTVYSFLFLAIGKAKEGCFLGALRQGICFIPAIYILPVIWGSMASSMYSRQRLLFLLLLLLLWQFRFIENS